MKYGLKDGSSQPNRDLWNILLITVLILLNQQMYVEVIIKINPLNSRIDISYFLFTFYPISMCILNFCQHPNSIYLNSTQILIYNGICIAFLDNCSGDTILEIKGMRSDIRKEFLILMTFIANVTIKWWCMISFKRRWKNKTMLECIHGR